MSDPARQEAFENFEKKSSLCFSYLCLDINIFVPGFLIRVSILLKSQVVGKLYYKS